MVFHKLGGVKTPETRKSDWWLRCVAATLLTQDITVSVCANAVQPRQTKTNPLETAPDKHKGRFFAGLIFNT